MISQRQADILKKVKDQKEIEAEIDHKYLYWAKMLLDIWKRYWGRDAGFHAPRELWTYLNGREVGFRKDLEEKLPTVLPTIDAVLANREENFRFERIFKEEAKRQGLDGGGLGISSRADILQRFKRNPSLMLKGCSVVIKFQQADNAKWKIESIHGVDAQGNDVERGQGIKAMRDLINILISNLELAGWYPKDGTYYYNTFDRGLSDFRLHGISSMADTNENGHRINTFYINAPKAYDAYIS